MEEIFSAFRWPQAIVELLTFSPFQVDEEGKVLEAKATTGPKSLRDSAEDAARRTKFKPVLLNGQPIKASGFINYNFVGQQ